VQQKQRQRRNVTDTNDQLDLKAHIRGIPDFPKPGILFYDISTLLRHGPAWRAAMARMARAISPYKPDLLAGIESRGFLVAAPLALELGLGFIMLRKQGKLPGERIGLDYALEYGTDRVEMQADAISPGQRVVILDDLLATGGTMAAGIALLRQAGAVVPAAAALIELSFLEGRKKRSKHQRKVPFGGFLRQQKPALPGSLQSCHPTLSHVERKPERPKNQIWHTVQR
jgi:adenine phosphoribosyltransferase